MICCVSRAKMHIEDQKSVNPKVFGRFSIFSYFLNFAWFGIVSLWISNPCRDLLPGNASKSLRGWNFTQNDDFIKDVIGRNKKMWKIWTFGYRCFHHSAFVQSSPFACAHHFTFPAWENCQIAKRSCELFTHCEIYVKTLKMTILLTTNRT